MQSMEIDPKALIYCPEISSVTCLLRISTKKLWMELGKQNLFECISGKCQGKQKNLQNRNVVCPSPGIIGIR